MLFVQSRSKQSWSTQKMPYTPHSEHSSVLHDMLSNQPVISFDISNFVLFSVLLKVLIIQKCKFRLHWHFSLPSSHSKPIWLKLEYTTHVSRFYTTRHHTLANFVNGYREITKTYISQLWPYNSKHGCNWLYQITITTFFLALRWNWVSKSRSWFSVHCLCIWKCK